MSAISSVLKFAARTGWVFTSNIVGFTLIGLGLNILFFTLLPDRCSLNNNFGQVITNCADAVFIGALFLPLFPILYAVLGYKYALQKTLQFGYVQNKDFFYKYIISRFVNFLDKNQYTGGALGSVANLAGSFFKHLDNFPFFFRGIIKIIGKFVPFADIIERVAENYRLTQDNVSNVAEQIAHEAESLVKDELLQPDTTLPKILFAINFALFALFKWAI